MSFCTLTLMLLYLLVGQPRPHTPLNKTLWIINLYLYHQIVYAFELGSV